VLAVLLKGHSRLEEGHRRAIQIEFSCHAFFSLGRLVCQEFHILFCLDIHMKTPWDRLWGRNVTVRIDGSRSFWGATKL
jgi:hypothetical protein